MLFMDNFSMNNPTKEEKHFSLVFWIIISLAIVIILVIIFILFNGGAKKSTDYSNQGLNKSTNSSQNSKINRTSSNSSIVKKENQTQTSIFNNTGNTNIIKVNNTNITSSNVSSEISTPHKLNVSLGDYFLKSNSTDTNISQPVNNMTNSSLRESRELNLYYQVYYSSSVMSGIYNQYSDSENSLLDPILTYEIENLENFSITLNFVSEIQGYSLVSTDKIKIPANANYTLNQNPSLNPGLNLQELTNANLHYKIELSGDVLQEETLPIKLYAKDTMIWGYYLDGEFVDMSYWIAAWVTPHATEIDELISKSAKYHPDNAISGYLCDYCESEAEWQDYTNAQVKAIYTALKNDYKITYINAPIAYASNQESPQRVKLPKDSIRLSSANCIDGTVLFASALESIGISPYIELVPGHAFLCYDLNPTRTSYDCLETTMIGSYSFEEAEEEGVYEANEYFNDPQTQFISVSDERTYGVMPIN